MRSNPMPQRRSRHVKRLIDFVVASVGLTVSAPALAIAAASVRATMGGPVLFRQVRPGLDAKPFTVLKVRTMTDARDSEGNLLPADQRLTRLGRVLRATSIDEIPQLWNVLRGDMSLVGPRPLLTEYLELYDAEQSRRHSVRPGLTGLAQITGRQSLPFSKRIALDLEYIDSWSLQLDFHILWQTVKQLTQTHEVNPHASRGRINDLTASVDRPGEDQP